MWKVHRFRHRWVLEKGLSVGCFCRSNLSSAGLAHRLSLSISHPPRLNTLLGVAAPQPGDAESRVPSRYSSLQRSTQSWISSRFLPAPPSLVMVPGRSHSSKTIANTDSKRTSRFVSPLQAFYVFYEMAKARIGFE